MAEVDLGICHLLSDLPEDYIKIMSLILIFLEKCVTVIFLCLHRRRRVGAGGAQAPPIIW